MQLHARPVPGRPRPLPTCPLTVRLQLARVLRPAASQSPAPTSTLATTRSLHPHPPRASPGDGDSVQDEPAASTPPPPSTPLLPRIRRAAPAASTDAVASALTRRFGLAGGLAWLGVLTAGVVGEQVKTRLEVAEAAKTTRAVDNAPVITLPDGTTYQDVVAGGGTAISKGLLVALHSTLTANGLPVDDTLARKKPIVFIAGTRPLTGGLTPGAEAALAGMRAGGVRVVTVPPASGFGSTGATLRPTEHVPEKRGDVPPNATLTYRLQVVSVSVPPS